MITRVWCGLLLLAWWPLQVRAQGDCFPANDSHEAQTFAILSAPLAFSGAAASVQGGVGLEAASIPDVPDDIATPTTCRPGKGPENTNPVAGFVRLRLGLAAGNWLLEAGWIPPVRVNGMRSNLVGVGLTRLVPIGARWRVLPRVHALIGRVRGPITCNAEALADATSECFEGTLSNDRWDPNILGFEATAVRMGGVLAPHLGMGWTLLRPRFQVDFTNSFGDVDRRKVEVDLERLSLFGGVTVAVGRLQLTGEGYLTLGDRVAGRMVARLPLHGGFHAASP